MLFWLAEDLALENAKLDAAFDAVILCKAKSAPQCAALRNHVAWADIESGIATYDYNWSQRLRIKLAGHSFHNGG